MKRERDTETIARMKLDCARTALHHLRKAQELLGLAGAKRTKERVRLAITSAGGAVRNCEYRLGRAQAR